MAKRQKRQDIALEASYDVTSADGSIAPLGIRAVYTLKRVRAVSEMAKLSQAIRDDDHVIFWVVRPAGAEKYILVSVGAGTEREPLEALRLDHPGSIDPLVASGQCLPLDQEAAFSAPLGGPGTTVKSLTMWLEAPAGDRYPLPIGFIGHVDTAGDAKMIFADVALAVLSIGSGGHRAIWLVDLRTPGPPGADLDDICQSLRADNSQLAQTAANWLGCP